MFRVERKMAEGCWYEVMLSPFKTLEDAYKYLNKYINFYPENDRVYKIIINNEA